MPKRILFLCTGNYYRSRFAEHLFNHRAAEAGLDWQADSRALAIELGSCNVGPISPYARDELQKRGIDLPDMLRSPQACLDADLQSADLVVAVKEAEHRAMMASKFPAHESRVIFWHVHDLDVYTPDEALGMIVQRVDALIARLSSERTQ